MADPIVISHNNKLNHNKHMDKKRKKELFLMFEEYEDLVGIEELCSMLSIGKTMAYEMLRSKQIKAFRIGRSWKIPKKSVEEYILLKSRLIK